jgi:antitoxin (DNA-binding transcriptional repressor) of toxin-antitoxin stability system
MDDPPRVAAEEAIMVRTVSIQQASAQLAELVRMLEPGDQIVLTDGDQHVARIVPEAAPLPHRKAGACRGMLEILDDGDAGITDAGTWSCGESSEVRRLDCGRLLLGEAHRYNG